MTTPLSTRLALIGRPSLASPRPDVVAVVAAHVAAARSEKVAA